MQNNRYGGQVARRKRWMQNRGRKAGQERCKIEEKNDRRDAGPKADRPEGM